MVWFFIEVLVALLLAVFIVWFTMSGRRKTARPPAARDSGEKD